MTPRDTSEAFAVGCWSAYPNENRLINDDRVVSVEPRVMSVLLRLAKTPGRITSVDELLDEVWPGQAHGDQAVYQAVGDLRKSLGDDARAPRYIETIPKRGYRLIAPVRKLHGLAGGEQAGARSAWSGARGYGLGIAAMLVLAMWIAPSNQPGEPVSAVGQGSDASQARAYDHYVTGMNALTRRSGYGQRALVEAEFRRAMEIDPGFAGAYTGLAEVLYRRHLQAGIRAGMSRAESAAEIPEAVEDLLSKAAELAPHLADIFVLRGRMAEDRGDAPAAESQYRAALQDAPDHVRALQGLASFLRERRQFAEARALLDRALALEPRNPALLFDVMHVLNDASDFDELMRFAGHAVAMDPDSASIYFWLNRYHMALGRPDRSISLLTPLLGDPRFDTEQASVFSLLSAAYLMLGDVETAWRYEEQARQRAGRRLDTTMWKLLIQDHRHEFVRVLHDANADLGWYPHPVYKAHLETLVGHNDHALAILEAAMTRSLWNPDDTDVLIQGWQPGVTAASVFYATGQEERARALLRNLRPVLQEATRDPRRRSGAYYFLAAIESMEGNGDAALERLQQAADSGWSVHWLIDHDPAFRGLRQAPGYRRIADAMRERMEHLRQDVLADEDPRTAALATHRVQFDPSVVCLAERGFVTGDRPRLAITTRAHPRRIDSFLLEVAANSFCATL